MLNSSVGRHCPPVLPCRYLPGLSRGRFHVQILKYFSILACRVLDSVLGFHDSIKLG